MHPVPSLVNFSRPDGKIGHVEDFIVEDNSWVIRYMVVDTVTGVLVAPEWGELA